MSQQTFCTVVYHNKEQNREEEASVPKIWIDKKQNVLRWPKNFNENIRNKPKEGWTSYALLRVKHEGIIF